jgi:hypothetical protein
MERVIGGICAILMILSLVPTCSEAQSTCTHPKVLLTGGFAVMSTDRALESAELFDPSTDTFSATSGSMLAARAEHTATRLPNGMVLIAGGVDTPGGNGLNTAELYDPSSGSFQTTGSMHDARFGQKATLLKSGNVLIAGGMSSAQAGALPLSTVEIYVARKGAFRHTASLLTPGADSASLLPNGGVLVTSGTVGELFNPATQTFSQTANSMTQDHDSAILLDNGQVLVAGNNDPTPAPADLYNPSTGTFTITTGKQPMVMSAATATLLAGGKVMFAGGYAYRLESDRLVFYHPFTESFIPVVAASSDAHLSVPRVQHTATKLPDGRVLIAGGWNQSCNPSCAGGNITVLDTAEIFDPSTNQSTEISGRMTTPRFGHTATLVCTP